MLDKIKARIETLKKERDEFIQEANQRVRAYAVGIAELEAIIAPEPEAPTKEIVDGATAQQETG